MHFFDYDLKSDHQPRLGLIVLQSDERIEQDFRQLVPEQVELFVSRVPSGLDVTPETLQAMDAEIPKAAELLPRAREFDAVGYGCTSGTAQIGPQRIAKQVQAGVETRAVTDPLSALVAACRALKIERLAFLSPYVEAVSDQLRRVLRDNGVQSPVFGSFGEAKEARVSRIKPSSIAVAARDLVKAGEVDGIFLSCTNLNTLDVIASLEEDTGLPILSSNQVLAWHLCRLAGVTTKPLLATRRLEQACRTVG